jgi:hypothetical protein
MAFELAELLRHLFILSYLLVPAAGALGAGILLGHPVLGIVVATVLGAAVLPWTLPMFEFFGWISLDEGYEGMLFGYPAGVAALGLMGVIGTLAHWGALATVLLAPLGLFGIWLCQTCVRDVLPRKRR